MSEPGRFHPLSVADLIALQLPDREDIVDGGLLVAGSLTLFSAREKSGKTMLCTDLACAVASEEPFLDRSVRCGPVIFVALEENIREVRKRFLDRLGLSRDVPLFVLPANGFTDDVVRLDLAESMAALAGMIREFSAAVLIIDTMREAHRLRENEADDMAPLTRPLRQIAHDANCAIILLHHQNKTGGSRESTAIAAGVDQLWSFQRTDADHDAGPPVGRLTVEGRFGPRQVLGIRLGEGLRWEVDHAITLADQTMRGRILVTLGQHVAGLTAIEITDALAGNLKSVQNEISRMLQENPAPIIATGSGTKGKPRRYLSVTPTLFPTSETLGGMNRGHLQEDSPHCSGNNVTNEEMIPHIPSARDVTNVTNLSAPAAEPLAPTGTDGALPGEIKL
jgi:KaiC/GvpD/RAD55 family RecA-like ATPase